MSRRILVLTIALVLSKGAFPQTDFKIVSVPAAPLPTAVLGEFYKVTFSTTGGYATYGPWVVANPAPDGMTFDTATGVLSGSPTKVGNYKWSLGKSCCNGLGTAGILYDIKVVGPLAILTTAVPGAYSGAAYSFQFMASGGAPPYTWSIPLLSLPLGMTLDSASGTLSGQAQGNQDFTFTVTVTDKEARRVSKTFTLTVQRKPQIAFNSSEVKFDSSASGPKQTKTVSVGASGGGSLNVTVTPDVPKPDWIKVEPPEATTPVEVKIHADPKNVGAGTYTTNVTVIDKSGQAPPVPIHVTLDVLFQPPKLEYTPGDLRLTSGATEGVPKAAYLSVRNGGSGPLDVSAEVTSKTPWLAVAPKSLTAPPGESAAFSVAVDPGSLTPGAYSGTIHLGSPGGNADVPVSFVKGDTRPRLETSFQGLQFYGRPGQAATAPQEIEIRNAGTGSILWQASLIKDQGNFLVTPLSGTVTPGSPSKMTIQARPQNLASGIHYGLLRIFASQGAQTSQDIMLVVNVVPTATPMPELSPGGLIFAVRPVVVKTTQDLKLYTDSSAAVDFQVAANTASPQQWLSVSPSSGKVSNDAPATLSVNASSFAVPKEGVYTGTVSVSFSGALIRTIPVTMIVSSAVPEQKPAGVPARVSAAAQRLVLTTTRPASQFLAAAGGPVPLSAIVTDEAGNPVPDADVSVAFSNGDAALPMGVANSATGLYTATWIPAGVGAATLTVQAAQGNLPVESAEVSGTVEANPNVPVLARNGVLNNVNGVLGAPLAPGTVAAIFGTALAAQTITQVPVPLPVDLGGTKVYIGGREAPLYYVTPGQIAIQIPTELEAGSPQAVTVVNNNAVSVPTTVNLSAVSPGLVAFPDGKVVAQHPDYSLITSGAPARSGEWITLYLVGMGATDVPVASGRQSPASPLANVRAQPTVTIDGVQAQVAFAGLTPGGIGLYQINCKVPESARAGDLTLIVTQNGVEANSVVIPVAR